MKVLLVEDENVTGLMFADSLRKAGHAVTRAHDGAEALGIVRSTTFDACVCDVVMPRMSGLEFLFEARKQKLMSCPVVVVTGLSEHAADGIDVAAVLTKPVAGRDLVKVVEACKR